MALVYQVQTETHANSVWVTNGTLAGTRQLAILDNSVMWVLGQKVILFDGGLRSLDLTGASAVLNSTLLPAFGTDSGSVQKLGKVLGNKLVFTAGNSTYGDELWVTDGTAAGTRLLKDIDPGTADSSIDLGEGLIALGSKLIFEAISAAHGQELWVTDGTPAGTTLLKDINPGTSWSFPDEFTVLNGRLYFTADDTTHGDELWVTDGTSGGTRLVADINPGAPDSSINHITALGSKIVFAAYDGTTKNVELWTSDGTAGGTVLLKDINPTPGVFGGSHPHNFTKLGNSLVCTANSSEVWITNGTTAGTQLLKDIWDGSTLSDPRDYFAIGNKLVFRAGDATHGTELWVTDGTNSGTILLKDIFSGPGSSTFRDFTLLGNKLVFIANDGIHGEELWVTDGTPAGTKLLRDINVGAAGSSLYASELSVLGSKIFFFAYDNSRGLALWSTDGTTAGTILFKDHNPATDDFYSTFFVDININTNIAPVHIGLSNASVREHAATGSFVGTLSALDFNAGNTHTYTLLTNAGGRFYVSGNQLRVTDGTKLDFEQTASLNILVRATDQGGKYLDKTFSISLNNVTPENVTGNAWQTSSSAAPATTF